MSAFSEMAAGALALVRSVAGDPVAYKRGVLSVTLTATIGKSQIEAPDSNGVVSVIDVRDFMFAAADLILGGNVTLPVRGDKIVETRGGFDYTYRILPSNSLHYYDFSDSGRTQIRVHSVLDSLAPHV